MTMDGIPQITPPEDCKDMGQVRAGIDKLDRALVALLAQRQRYIAAAGRLKHRRDEVRLPWRIEEVVSKVLAESDKQGLSKRIAEPVWRVLIDQSIEYEHEIWVSQHDQAEE